MMQCNTPECLKAAYNSFEGNNFMFDFYESLNTIKFFTRESLENATFLIETLGQKNGSDFQVIPHFDYDSPSVYSFN